ncbi:DsrE family protein [Desulfovibrio sp. UCD-KL4C]|uniref:DsrE family protein n=1 Tax=Desulfovibrio sp. UCD-KL4C TaxID=2578120 RepID=UPI0025C4D44C|nr:DsrE family protein [Desulfovibrio sp. UCD-KL4C]
MSEKTHLYILWTNADVEVAEKMVFMYGVNSLLKGWWEEVTIILWGPTVKLVTENETVQKLISESLEAGVNMSACRSCAEMYGLSEAIEAQGVEVIYWGEPLTDLLKNNEKILTV